MEEPPFEAELAEPIEAKPAAPAKNSFASIGSLAIGFGILGLTSLCFSGGFAMMNYRAAAPTPPAAGAPAIQRFQYDLVVDMQGIGERYMPALVMFSAWQVFVAVLLIVGGVRVMYRSNSGRQFMLYVLLFTLLFEVLRAGMYVLMMMEMMPFIDEGMVRAIREAGAQDENVAKILKRMATGVTLIAVLVALVWPALKILYFGWAAKYLASRPAMEACER